MAIELVRIDDRLIHGQVVTTWVKQMKIEQILIINDMIAKDPIQNSVFKMTAPQNVKVQSFEVDKFINIAKKTEIKRRTLLLLTNPADVLRLHRGGVEFDQLNLGGMKYTTDRKQYTKAISLTDQEREDLRILGEEGVAVSVQMIPSDKLTTLKELMEMEGK